MFAMKKRNLAASFALTAASVTAAGLTIATPAAQASTVRASAVSPSQCVPDQFSFECESYFSAGEHLQVLYGNSPLRDCASTRCRVITYMPATRNFRRGGGWVTSEAHQNPNGAWCVINYRNTIGWTGCWRLSV